MPGTFLCPKSRTLEVHPFRVYALRYQGVKAPADMELPRLVQVAVEGVERDSAPDCMKGHLVANHTLAVELLYSIHPKRMELQ